MTATAACVLVLAIGPARAQTGSPDARGMLVVAKMTGACGIMNAMLGFQSATKMTGGDEFVVRFWTTESARLGMTLQQYAERCKAAIRLYDRIFDAAEQHRGGRK
jgi:hypothetical protein